MRTAETICRALDEAKVYPLVVRYWTGRYRKAISEACKYNLFTDEKIKNEEKK